MPIGSGIQQTKIPNVKERMRKFSISGMLLFFFMLLLAACSPRIYRPPALGAEYQFDRGMPPAKHPSTLFDKKTTKDLEEKGIFGNSTSSGVATPAAGKADSSARNPTRVADSARTDSLTTPASSSSPALPDSSRNGQD